MSISGIYQMLARPSASSAVDVITNPPAINPADVTEVLRWFDMGNLANTNVSGRLTEIVDKKGNGNLNQTSTLFPSYTASGGPNDAPFITIDPTQQIYNSVNTIGVPVLAFMVYRMKSLDPVNTGGDYLRSILTFLNRDYGFVVNNLDAGYGPYLDYGGNYHATRYKNAHHTNWSVTSFKMNGVTDTELRFNKEPCGLTCKQGLTALGGSVQLGYFGYSANYEVAEIVIADASTISLANENGIRRWLLDKYLPTIKQAIIYFGDSLSHGNCDHMDYHFYYTSDENNLDLVNYGQGTTIVFPNNGSTGIADRNLIDVYQAPFDWPIDNHWFHFGYGVNDVNQSFGLNAAWKAGYKAILQEYLAKGADPSKMIIVKQPSTSIRQATMAQAFTYITEIATELGIVLYDANARFIANGGDTLFGDTLHPSIAGNRVYADGMNLIINP